jgi:DNA-binding response OmpR family regulator
MDAPCQITDLAAENARLRSLIADSAAVLPINWKLTRTEDSVFRVLLAHDIASAGLIVEADGGPGSVEAVRVFIHRLRTKLAGIAEIETIAGRGWRLVARESWRLSIHRNHQQGA